MTLETARRVARKASRDTRETVYVVREDGFQVATEYDLDTWFAGLRDESIVAAFNAGREEER